MSVQPKKLYPSLTGSEGFSTFAPAATFTTTFSCPSTTNVTSYSETSTSSSPGLAGTSPLAITSSIKDSVTYHLAQDVPISLIHAAFGLPKSE